MAYASTRNPSGSEMAWLVRVRTGLFCPVKAGPLLITSKSGENDEPNSDA